MFSGNLANGLTVTDLISFFDCREANHYFLMVIAAATTAAGYYYYTAINALINLNNVAAGRATNKRPRD